MFNFFGLSALNDAINNSIFLYLDKIRGSRGNFVDFPLNTKLRHLKEGGLCMSWTYAVFLSHKLLSMRPNGPTQPNHHELKPKRNWLIINT